jgi:hypothetical protein
VRVVLERHVGRLEPPVPLDVDLVGAIDQDVRHVGIAQQRLERTQAEQLVDDVRHQAFAFEQAERGRVPLAHEDAGQQ